MKFNELFESIMENVDKSALHNELLLINKKLRRFGSTALRGYSRYAQLANGASVKDVVGSDEDLDTLKKRKEEILKQLKA